MPLTLCHRSEKALKMLPFKRGQGTSKYSLTFCSTLYHKDLKRILSYYIHAHEKEPLDFEIEESSLLNWGAFLKLVGPLLRSVYVSQNAIFARPAMQQPICIENIDQRNQFWKSDLMALRPAKLLDALAPFISDWGAKIGKKPYLLFSEAENERVILLSSTSVQA